MAILLGLVWIIFALLIIPITALIIYLWYRLAKNMEKISERKGYYGIHAFFWCFCFGVLGYIFVLALPDKEIKKQNEEIIALLKKEHKKEEE